MPDVVINELSVTGQAANRFAADDLMRGLGRALQALKRGKDDLKVYTHSDLANKRLHGGTGENTVHDWLSGPLGRELQPVRLLLLTYLRRGPFLDLLMGDAPHVCYHTFQNESIDHPLSGLAGAARLRVALLSFAGCTRFPSGPVRVRYGVTDADAIPLALQHFLDDREVDRARRKYEPHTKHTGGASRGVRGTPMDLSTEDAQAALDQCVSSHDERRVCARFRSKIYVFHPHSLEENLYHGFPMDESEVREKMPSLYRLLLLAD
jgi:hypothetical protein